MMRRISVCPTFERLIRSIAKIINQSSIENRLTRLESLLYSKYSEKMFFFS